MATETTIRLIDDVSGGTAERTVTFTWEGTTYEIDLSKKNIAAFEKAIKPFLDGARTTRTGRPSRRRGAARSSSAANRPNAEVRDWARANGYEVSERGRIASHVIEAYHAAQ